MVVCCRHPKCNSLVCHGIIRVGDGFGGTHTAECLRFTLTFLRQRA